VTNKEYIEKIVESIVKKELQQLLPVMVPHVIKEVMANLILETKISSVSPMTIPSNGNAHKRKALTENAVQFETDTKTTAALSSPFGLNVGGKMIQMDTMVDEVGNVIPIRADAITNTTINALEDAMSGKAKLIFDSAMEKSKNNKGGLF
jgi:hypothetical protein